MRAGLLPQEDKLAVRKLLKDYAQIRIDLNKNPEQLQALVAKSKLIQSQLWTYAEKLKNTPLLHSDVLSLFAEGLDEMIQLQTERLAVALIHHLPPVMWIVLYLLTILSMMGLGYQFGLDQQPNWGLFMVLSLGFSAVMLLIVDLDGSGSTKNSLIQISIQPIHELVERMDQFQEANIKDTLN
jgi:hypothetical protein